VLGLQEFATMSDLKIKHLFLKISFLFIPYAAETDSSHALLIATNTRVLA
jgi:hypothetical protein